MNHAFFIYVLKFGEEIGMKSEFAEAMMGIHITIVIVALILCFFGIRYFRISAGVSIFFIFAIMVMYVMRNANRGHMVITFIVFGLMLMAVTMRWYRISAFIMSALIGYSLGATYMDIGWLLYLIVCACVIATYIFPAYGMLILTALWGGFTVVIDGASLLNIHINQPYIIIACVVLSIVGAVVQGLLSKQLLMLPRIDRVEKISK